MVVDVSSSLDIMNNALILLDQSPMDSAELTANTTKTAKACNIKWPTTRNSLLRLHPWNCVRDRQVLTVDETAPAFGYSYRYELPDGTGTPPKCIRPLAIQYEQDGHYFPFASGTFGGDIPLKYSFVIENSYLLTNTQGTTLNRDETEGINLVYTFLPKSDAVADYDDTLIELMYYKLASEIAFTVTGSRNLGLTFKKDFKELLKEARAINAQEIAPGIPVGAVLGAYSGLSYTGASETW